MELSARTDVNYTKESGAKLVRVFGKPMTVYAVREDLRMYVGLPESWWISHLGFSACMDVVLAQPTYLATMADQGIIMLEV